MTNAEQIATIKSQTLAIMASITSSPKPTYNIDGQSISWGEYLAQLQNTVEWCNSQTNNETPYEIVSQGYSP